MNKVDFLNALESDTDFAARVMKLLIPYLKLDLYVTTERVHDYYMDGSGKDVLTIEPTFYVEGDA